MTSDPKDFYRRLISVSFRFQFGCDHSPQISHNAPGSALESAVSLESAHQPIVITPFSSKSSTLRYLRPTLGCYIHSTFDKIG